MRFDKIAYLTLIGFLLLMLVLSFCSCEVLKTKQSKSVDSTVVSKVDSGSLKTVKTDTKDSSNWWRETVEFLLNKPSGDTTIVHNVTTPVRIIREGGNQVSTDKTETNELAWRNSLDSLNNRITELSKAKETKVLTQWWIWLIVGLVGLAALKILLPFKIVQK